MMFKPRLLETFAKYSSADFKADLGAGLVVGLVALPLAMAFAIASGLKPEQGLFTAVVAGFLISALGGSKVQIGGPTGAFVVIVSGVVLKYGYEGLALATFMAGAILIAMGLLRMGSLIKFIPYPVTTGFTTGIAVVIFSGQIRDYFGLPASASAPEFVHQWKLYLHALPQFSAPALALALGVTLVTALWPRSWKVPGSLVAIVAAALAAVLLHLPVETIESRFGAVPHTLPHPSLPPMDWGHVRGLLRPAFAIALLAAIESLLSAVVADGMTGDRHDSNTELVGQGIANLAAPLFGGFCATGAIARTATNVKNGGRTPVAGMVHALVLLLILLLAAPLAGKIPMAALAGILAVVCYHMSEWRSFRDLLKGPKEDALVLLVTFLLTVLVDLTVAVEVGMVLAAFLFMKQMASLAQVKALTRDSSGATSFERDPSRQGLVIPQDVEVFELHGSFFFGAASQLLETTRVVEKKPRAVILDMRGVLHLDATGMRALENVHKDCSKRGIRFILSGLHSQAFILLDESGLLAKWGKDAVAGDLKEALAILPAPQNEP